MIGSVVGLWAFAALLDYLPVLVWRTRSIREIGRPGPVKL